MLQERPIPEESLLTTTEVATMLGISPGRLRNLRSQGRAPRAVKIGKSVRWKLADVRAFVAANAEPETAATHCP